MHKVPPKVVPSLCRELNMKPADFNPFGPGLLQTGDGKRHFMVPVIRWSDLGRIAGGRVVLAKTKPSQFLEVDDGISTECVALAVNDDSMEPIFYSGEAVLIDPAKAKDPQQGDFVVARLKDGTHLLRRYIMRRGKAFDLQAEKETFPTISSGAENHIEIIGIVVEHRKRHFP